MFNKILVALDGSEPANHALTYAIDSAEKWEAELLVLTVTPFANTTVYLGDFDVIDLEEWQKSLKDAHKQILMKAEDTLKLHPNVEYRTIIVEGRSGSKIVDVANKENVDLIVVGNRGFGGLTGYILGSTSRHVVDHCEKPILVIK